MALLESWTRGEHTDLVNGVDVTHPTYRKGSGPGVIVIHEIPGLTPSVIGFGEEVVAAGFTVVMPSLFGTPERKMNALSVARTLGRVCVNREFSKLALRETSPMAGWLRSLARELHDELGGPGVGALGMCFTGGFALAMMVDDAVAAPVLCQPSTPFAVSPARSRDLNLSPADLATVKDRAAAGCQVLGLQFTGDPMTGKRFETLTHELGDAFIRVEFPGRDHSTVTEHRQQEAVDRVLAFFHEKLDRPTPA
jgi:dienelactone hydrolase